MYPSKGAPTAMSPTPSPSRSHSERILPPPHSLDRLIRYETMIDRELLRTMRQLDLRQRLRKSEQSPQPQGERHGQEYLPMPPDSASHWQQAASGTPALFDVRRGSGSMSRPIRQNMRAIPARIRNGHETSCDKSGRSDSNRRRPAWEAGILPLNYARTLDSCNYRSLQLGVNPS